MHEAAMARAAAPVAALALLRTSVMPRR